MPSGTRVLDDLLDQEVVLNTAGPMVYLGRLITVHAEGFWLADADVHNCNEGHAGREQYVVEAARSGVQPNRAKVFVLRHTIVDISNLRDVITD